MSVLLLVLVVVFVTLERFLLLSESVRKYSPTTVRVIIKLRVHIQRR